MSTKQRREIKIGILVEAFPVISETFIVNKVRYLLNLGYDVRVFTLKESNQWNFFPDLTNNIPDIKNRVLIGLSIKSLNELLTNGLVKLISELFLNPLATIKFLIYNLFLSDNRFLTPIERVFARINFNKAKLDILSVEFDTLGYKVVDLKPLLKCKIFTNTMGIAQATNTYQTLPDILNYLNKYADTFRFASQFLKENSFKLGLSRKIKNIVIYSGVSTLFTRSNIPKLKRTKNEKFKIISVGRLAWSKGYEFGLEAISIIKRAGINIQYTIIGDGPYKDAVYYASEQFNLKADKTVVFKGALPLRQIGKELEKADIFLQSSVAEGFGISALEAQAMGLPVVATDAGGLPENIENFKTGFIVPKRNSMALAQKIIYLYNNKKRLQSMGKNGMKRVRKNFTLKKEIELLTGIYDELLETKFINY